MSVVMSPTLLDKPQTGDYGSTFWTDLEALFQGFNDHTHSGTDSNKLPASSILGSIDTTSITALNWTTVGPGNLTNTAAIPAAYTLGRYKVSFYDANKEEFLFKYRISGSTLTVYSNTAVAATILYTS